MSPGKPQLVALLRERIRNSPNQAISFCEYMERCLYDQQYGYYMDDSPKIGKEGDFYTSSSIGTVMGDMLARFFLRERDRHGGNSWTIVEWGGGNGRMASHILDEIARISPRGYEQLRYCMIETSEYHRQLQRKTLAGHAEKVHFLDDETWTDGLDPTYSIVFSNELLDAFPVHIVENDGDNWLEVFVCWDEQAQRFAERLLPPENAEIAGYIARFIATDGRRFKPGYRAEINLESLRWLRRIAGHLRNGLIVTVDYGGTAEELYSPHRRRGTLMCYRKHVAHDNPYIYAGEQDITAHVNFSACIRTGLEAGVKNWRLITQKQFLMEAGILGELKDHGGTDPFAPSARRNRAIRQLLISDGMSELFKVLLQYKSD